jgi:hypothetical protein
MPDIAPTDATQDINALFYLDEEDEYLIVNKTLACAIGLNESIALRRVHKWIKHNARAKSEKHFRDERYWCFNTAERWQETEFEFWSVDTVRRTFANLEKLGLIVVANYNERKGDQTKWYTVNYDAYLAFLRLWLNHQRPAAGNGRKSPAYLAFLEDWTQQRLPYATCINGIDHFGNMHKATTQVAQTVTNVLNTTKEKKKSVAAATRGSTTRPRAPVEERPKAARPRDPMFDAVASVWNTTAGGWVGTLKSMMLGKATRKAWAACNFEQPATPDEVRAFGAWVKRKNPHGQVPTIPETIQRQFYEFRAEQQKKTARRTPDESLFLSQEELDALIPSPFEYVRTATVVA